MTNTTATEISDRSTQAVVEQSNTRGLDHGAVPPVRLARVSANELNSALCSVEIDEIRGHHLALAMAVIELAADSGSPFPWGHDDPTIALLRAAAKLSMTSPDATSSAAADLVARLSSDGHAAR